MKTIINNLLLLTLATAAEAASPASISLEIVMEQGVQATAPRDWLQLLTGIGQQDVRIRSQRPGEEPQLEQLGTPERPRYRVVGVLTVNDQLLLPGGRFDLRSRAKIRDYFDRLGADGAEGVTAERGRFGLTEKQFRQVHADLSQTIGFATKGQSLVDVLKQLRDSLDLSLIVDDRAWEVLNDAGPVADEVEQLTIGTGLALLVRSHGMVLVPDKQRGQDVTHRIARAVDVEGESWPVGWQSDALPRQLAPEMLEYLNAEVEGFKLTEAIDAIAPRAGVPIYWDHRTLAERKIDPATIEVRYARRRAQLIRVVDQLLFQARLRGELKVDEAGTVFYWISR